jgi:cellulose biosynthesis protein BcsQ
LSSAELDFIPEIARKSKGFNVPEIDVIPSHITLIDEQDRLNRISAVPFRLNTKLQQVEDRYDIVIIDAPPSRDLYAQIALISADYAIIPSDMKPFSNQGLTNVKKFIREINETRSTIGKEPLQVLGVLASKILTNSKYLEFVFPKQKEAVLQRYQLPMLKTVIYERVALSHCVNQTVSRGDMEIPDPKSVFEFERDGDSVKEFRNLSSEVMQNIGL